jgi:hypothetical protein
MIQSRNNGNKKIDLWIKYKSNDFFLLCMVLGFGKGKIEIKLNKLQFSPGETVSGIVHIRMKNPTRAKALKVSLVGEKKVRSTRMTSKGMSSSGGKSYIFNFEMPLAGEGNYSAHDVPFNIKIPENVLQGNEMKGFAGDILKGLQYLSGTSSSISWYVKAWLDIPKGFDVSKKVQVNVS